MTLKDKLKNADRQEDDKQLKLIKENENIVSVFPRIMEARKDLKK